MSRPASTVTAFLTDSTLCIGCKACEVACKEWNDVPSDGYAWSGHSYDNTGALGHSTWRHVKFVESSCSSHEQPATSSPSWQFSSDVCKHCENAGCLEGCPTGAIVRTEFGGVFVQPDICNGCGYCVVTCPFGVVDRRPGDGRAFKCTFCYDRQKAGLKPACATACPTESILFGPIDEMQATAAARIETLHARGAADATLYDAANSSVGGIHSLFILRGDPEEFNLPANPVMPTVHLRTGWTSAFLTSLGLAASAIAVFGYFAG
ncbi:MAG: 4Fe-4S dicluster domain-containing protein [Acidobacteriota bacterium]|nr:4Fe-4S dicluster domain-containing protein [Acidobacteriota bacterium]